MAKQFYSSLVFCILIHLYACDDFLNPIKTVYLTNWTTNDGIVKDAKVEMPNGIYTFGEKLRLIPNVLKGSNDNDTKWIAEKYWTFTTEFSGDDLYDRKNIQLIFDGVDGVAEVKLNGVVLGKMENMFRQYVFDIKDHLKNDSNKVVVSFQPPIDAAAKAFSEQTHEIPPKCLPDTVKGDCHINMLRKMQTSFGSVFGPSVPSVGFWRPVRIEAFLESSLREVITKVEDLNETFWRLHIDCYLANNTQSRIYGRMELTLDSYPKGIFFLDVSPNFQGEMVWSYHIDFNKTEVETWWPIGYGSQKLYNLTINYYSSDIVEVTPKIKMIGFRKIELVQDETGNGRNFYFAVNKVPIFAKGSTLVPVSIFPEDIDNVTTLKRIITDAVDSNMNMIRVWGGGTYLSDKFYELADKEGILIWQDFMFTSALYPSDENFLNNVLGEVNYQVKRIFSHPCLAVFSANFEIEQAFASNWYNMSNRREYANDYRQLFVKTIKKEFDRLTNNSKNFVFSSPSNGIRTENERYLSSNPNSEFYGDFHYLEQNKNPLNYIKYPIPRFVSAFGVQSLPSAESLLKQADNKKPSNLQANNQFLTHRQHMSSNFDQMREHIEYLLDLPPENALGVDQTFIFYSQIVQAFSLKLQIEHYRKYKSYLLADGRGNTMGALYWQMNDVWSAPSLSGIDYYGKWKMAQYLIKDAFSPVIIAGTIADNTLEVFVVSDLTKTVYEAIAKILVYNWNSFKPLYEETVPVVLLSLKAQQIYTTEVKELFEKLNCTLKDCFFYMQLEKSEDALTPENYVFPNNSRGAEIPHHTINVTSVTQLPYQNIFEVQITSKYVSTFVWLDSHDLEGKFSENGFLMVKPQRTVYFFPDKEVTIEEIKKSIDVIHSHDPVIMPSASFSIQNSAYYLIIFMAFLHVTNILS